MKFECDLNKPEQIGRIPFLLVDSTDKSTEKTGLTPSVSFLDVGSGSFVAAANGITEIGAGIYSMTMAGQTLQVDAAGVIMYKMTGTSAIDAFGIVQVIDPASRTIGTVTTLTNAPSDSAGVTTLLSRLSSTRAGYLDNLNIGGNVASAASISALSIPTANDVRDAIFANVTDGSLRFDEMMRLMGSSVLALLSGAVSGGAGTATVKDIANTKTRFTWDYDANGNRTAFSIVDKAL